MADVSPREMPWGQITRAGLVSCDLVNLGLVLPLVPHLWGTGYLVFGTSRGGEIKGVS